MSEQGFSPLVQDKAIKASVDYAFGPKPKEPSVLDNIRKLNVESFTPKEKLLSQVKEVASKLASNNNLGPFRKVASEVARECNIKIWETAAGRVTQKINERALSNPSSVMATLNEIDPMIAVHDLNRTATAAELKVRGSTGITERSEVKLITSTNRTDRFPEDQTNPNRLILAGESFSKEYIDHTLSGNGPFKPMWTQDGLMLPLTRNVGQEPTMFLVKLDASQYFRLQSTLAGVKVNRAGVIR